MNDFILPIQFSTDDGRQRIVLRSPCILDCDTEVGFISLILDKDYPHYLLVQINGELRKCLGFEDYDLHFQDDEAVFQFLEWVRETEIFQEIVEDEKALDQDWAEL